MQLNSDTTDEELGEFYKAILQATRKHNDNQSKNETGNTKEHQREKEGEEDKNSHRMTTKREREIHIGQRPKEKERTRHREYNKDRLRDRNRDKDRDRDRDRDKDRDRERETDRGRERPKDRHRDRGRDRDRDKEKERDREKDRDREDRRNKRDRTPERLREYERFKKSHGQEDEDDEELHNKLFVANCDYRCTERDISDFFEETCKGFQGFYFLKRSRGGHCGFGFATFNTPDNANAARLQVRGKKLWGRDLAVRSASHYSKNEHVKNKSVGELEPKRTKYSHPSSQSPKSSPQLPTEEDNKKIEIVATMAEEEIKKDTKNNETIQPKVEETSDERENERKLTEKTQEEEVKERIARDREKVMKICELIVKDTKDGEEHAKKQEEGSSYPRGLSGLLPIPSISPRIIFSPPRIPPHHSYPPPPSRPYPFAPPFIPPTSFAPPTINPSLLIPKYLPHAPEPQYKFHPPHPRSYSNLPPEFSPLLPPSLDTLSASTSVYPPVLQSFSNISRTNQRSTLAPHNPITILPPFSNSDVLYAHSALSPNFVAEGPSQTPTHSPMALDSPMETTGEPIASQNSFPYRNNQHQSIFVSPGSYSASNTYMIAEGSATGARSLSPPTPANLPSEHHVLSPHSHALSPTTSSPSSPIPQFHFSHTHLSLTSSPVPASLTVSPLPPISPRTQTLEEPTSDLEHRIHRILQAQEQRHAAAYHKLARYMELIGKQGTGKEDKKEENEALLKGNSIAIETAAMFTKFGSSRLELVDMSSFKSNSALFSYLKILAERHGNNIWSGSLLKDGTKVCTLQGFVLSDSGPSPLDLPKELNVNFTARHGVWKKASMETTNIVLAPAKIHDLRRLQEMIEYLKRKDSAGVVVVETKRIYLFTPDMEHPVLGPMVAPLDYEHMCALFVTMK